VAQKTPTEWESTVYRMISKGARLNDREAREVIDYLSRVYGVAQNLSHAELKTIRRKYKISKETQIWWKSSECRYVFQAVQPPKVRPNSKEKGAFLNATCYTPECGGPESGNPDLRIGAK
jgi:rubredoxin